MTGLNLRRGVLEFFGSPDRQTITVVGWDDRTETRIELDLRTDFLLVEVRAVLAELEAWAAEPPEEPPAPAVAVADPVERVEQLRRRA